VERVEGLEAILNLSNFTAFELFFDETFTCVFGTCSSLRRSLSLATLFQRRLVIVKSLLLGCFDSRLNRFRASFVDGLSRRQLFTKLILVNRFDCTTCGWATLSSTLMLPLSERAILE
jgi:hypothetical protein